MRTHSSRSRVIASLVLAGLSSRATAQDALTTQFGAVGDYFGYSVAPAGDIDGDGFTDIVVGMPRATTAFGTRDGVVAVYSGSYLATGAGVARIREWEGPQGAGTPTRFGWSVDGNVDVDLDGVSDVLVGAADADLNGVLDSGAVMLFSGATGVKLAEFSGTLGEALGTSVAFAGDLNGDGWPDILAGGPANNTTFNPIAGRSYAYSGEWIARTAVGQTPATSMVLFQIVGTWPNEDFGDAVAHLGDLDQDGFDEFVVGGTQGGAVASGNAVVFHGGDAAIMASIDTPLHFEKFGSALASVGDVNDDGYLDLAVGGPLWEAAGSGINENNGRVEIISGEWILRTWQGVTPLTPRTLWQRTGVGTGDGYGASLCRVPDLDLDGIEDIAVGAPQDRGLSIAGPGYVEFLSGRTGAIVFRHTGDALGDRMGRAVASVGDVDGDGYPEVALGSPFNAFGGVNSGQARILHAMPPVGINVCTSSTVPNSSGSAARMIVQGSTSVALDGLVIGADRLPPSCRLLLFSGSAFATTPMGNGVRCIGGSLARVVTGNATTSGSFGARWLTGASTPGSTAYVQAWFRDIAGGGAQFNLSDAVGMIFTP